MYNKYVIERKFSIKVFRGFFISSSVKNSSVLNALYFA